MAVLKFITNYAKNYYKLREVLWIEVPLPPPLTHPIHLYYVKLARNSLLCIFPTTKNCENVKAANRFFGKSKYYYEKKARSPQRIVLILLYFYIFV